MAEGKGFAGLQLRVTKPEQMYTGGGSRSQRRAQDVGSPVERIQEDKSTGIWWVLGVIGILIGLVIIGNQDGGKRATTNTSHSVRQTPRPATTSIPVPKTPVVAKTTGAEFKKPRAGKYRLSLAEAVWCTGIGVGLDYDRPRLGTQRQYDQFNAAIAEFNRVCASRSAYESTWAKAKRAVQARTHDWQRNYRQRLR